jgi:2-oxoglutarate ferredoxin oxidoreductase subunit delta
MARGRIEVDVEKCKGCELCRSACPQNVIVLSENINSRGYRPVILCEHDQTCTGCALCAVVCPEACITVYRIVPHQKVVSMAM